VWANGDPDPDIPGLRNIYIPDNAASSSLLYDDFVVPAEGWVVVGLFSFNRMSFTGVTSAYWEIRRAVSESTSTLVASGTNAATQLMRPNTFDPRTELTTFKIVVHGLALHLSAGRYWLAVAPVASAGMQSFICPTSGRHAVGQPQGNNANAYYGSPRSSSLLRAETFAHSRAKDFALGVFARP